MSKKEEVDEYNNHVSNVAKQTSINFIGKIFQLIFSFITGILLARVLGPGLLGQYNIGNTVANFTANFTKLGFDQGFVRFIPRYKANNEEGKIKYLLILSFLVSAILSILIGSIFYFYSDFLALMLFNDIKMSGILKITSVLIFVFTYYRLSSSVLKGIKRVDFFTIISSIVVPATFLLSLLILQKSDVYTVILVRMISFLIGIILIMFFVLKKEKFINAKIKAINIKEYFNFSSPLLFIGLLYFLISHIDILMIGYFLESSDVGIYSVSVKVATITVFVLVSINNIFSPIISELISKGQIMNLEKLFKSTTKINLIFSFNFLLFIILFNEEILLIFGEGYIAGSYSLIILTFGHFINSSVGSTGMILTMSGNQKYEVYNSISICIINIVLNILLIPLYGIYGAAIATSISILIINIIKLIQVYKILRIHPYKKNYIRIIIISIISFLLISPFKYLNIINIYKLLLVITSMIIINFYLIHKFALEKDDQFILSKFKNKIANIWKG